MKQIWKHDYANFTDKIRKYLIKFEYVLCGSYRKTYALYRCYWHRQHSQKKDVIQYMTSAPNKYAGFGHGLYEWMNGIINADVLRLQYAYYPMVSSTWETTLGLDIDGTSVSSLLKTGYRIVRLPQYRKEDLSTIRNIIEGYSGERVIFLNELDQGYVGDLQIAYHYLKEHFWKSPVRRNDRIIYEADYYNVAMHIRRGDVAAFFGTGNADIDRRFLPVSYYQTIIKEFLNAYHGKKRIRIYLFSEGTQEEFTDLQSEQYELIYCLNQKPQDSFLHMCYADLLICGVSAFSIQPGLINQNIKFFPQNFASYNEFGEGWHMADATGHLIERDIMIGDEEK